MPKILVLNLGSTSYKFKLFDMDSEKQVLVWGEVENIGKSSSQYRIVLNGKEETGTSCCSDHGEAFSLCFSFLVEHHVLASLDEIDAVGYKAVHGGPISGTRLVDDTVLAIMEEYSSMAPAHNPVYIRMVRNLRERYPKLRQIVRFETSFHHTVPLYRAVYGVPYEWVEAHGIRKYGFHGSSHEYIAQKMNELEPASKRIISVHLGGSSSLCAINEGKSIATSMGATPQSGIFQNNRVGDFDVFCLPILAKKYQGSLDMVMKELSSRGGLLGISGVSNDLREVLQERDAGNARADLAVRAFVDGIVGYIGMFTAYLGGVDALVFTGGIGLNSSIIRALVCDQLGFLTLMLDNEKNNLKGDMKISCEQSKVSVWMLKTNEELIVAEQANQLLNSLRE